AHRDGPRGWTGLRLCVDAVVAKTAVRRERNRPADLWRDRVGLADGLVVGLLDSRAAGDADRPADFFEERMTMNYSMRIRLQDLRNGVRGLFNKNCRIPVAFVTSALLFYAAAFSQEATQTAPLAYKLQFRHKDWEHPELTRPATKSGSFRLSPTTAVNEVHEVENPNDTPSDFLRVEFKTEPVGRKSLSGRFYREEYPAGENFQKAQFENEQIRVTRLVCAPHKSLEVSAGASEPALLVSLNAVQFRGKSATKQTQLELGQTIWVARNRRERFENLGDAPMEFLRFDFRTAPLKPQELPKKGGK